MGMGTGDEEKWRWDGSAGEGGVESLGGPQVPQRGVGWCCSCRELQVVIGGSDDHRTASVWAHAGAVAACCVNCGRGHRASGTASRWACRGCPAAGGWWTVDFQLALGLGAPRSHR